MQYTAKTIEEAIKEGLADLGIAETEAQIEVISEPVKGLFGRVKGNAVVEITKKECSAKEVASEPEKKEKTKKCAKVIDEKELVSKILEYLGVEATVEQTTNGEQEVLNVVSENSSFIIGYRGEVLDALQTIAGAAANVKNDVYKKVVVDCEGYREKREETLVKLAHRLEEKANEIRRDVQLEPMCAFERRIIHTALADSQIVTTKSDGKEPERFVVIVPNNRDEFSKPYNAGRNERKDNKKGSKNYGRNNGKGRDRKSGFKKSGFTESKRVAPSGFGTYLGNSLKDKNN